MLLATFHKIMSTIEDFPFPTVVAINGFALGGGLEVCLACDYRVIADSANRCARDRFGYFAGLGWNRSITSPMWP